MTDRPQRELSDRVGERVRLFQRGSSWHATYQLDGRQIRKSLRAKTKKTAIQRALELDRKLSAGESPTRKEPATIEYVVNTYKEYFVAEQRAKSTISKYSRIISEIAELAATLGRHRISEIDLTFADKFKAQRAKNLAPKTAYNEMVFLQQFTKFAFTRQLVEKDLVVGAQAQEAQADTTAVF